MMTKNEMDCSECGGPATRVDGDCSKCVGEIELDWIEKVVGRRRFFWGGKFWDMVDMSTREMAENFIKRIKSGDIVNVHRRIYKNAKVGD